MLNTKNYLKELLIVGLVVGTILIMNYKVAQKAMAKSQPKTSEIHWSSTRIS